MTPAALCRKNNIFIEARIIRISSKGAMINLVVSCAFCGRRHKMEDEDLESWSVVCPCGAYGFAEEETGLFIDEGEGEGVVPCEFSSSCGKNGMLFDPAPVFVDELFRRWHVCWRPL